MGKRGGGGKGVPLLREGAMRGPLRERAESRLVPGTRVAAVPP